ncbi:helix-turn-helix DNA binding domain protein [Gordonia phage ObLaDi]|uniref:Helix-turn-helix DNA binding domain protein n=3 Tax=Cafassovirus TaxID=3425056 RepID=A0A9E7QBN6_9CAUD|nr:helix-turn-helix DNA binding domain protein [Gordonia phage Cafasso]UVK59742.1 helix-turn-helix DNA binding domain protein [Gordonia phage Aleemily]UXE03725.1 helix-turn-helix DNA binding domain protein [Gordonia phage ObLaDi]
MPERIPAEHHSPDRKKPPRMAMTAEERDQVRKLHEEGKGLNEIMRITGIKSKSMLSKFCKENGLTFDRSSTAAATAARIEDLKARQVAMAEKLMSTAEYLHTRFHDTYRYYVREGDEMMLVELPEIPLRETRDAVTAIGEAVRGHLTLFEAAGGDTPEVEKSMLVSLKEQLADYIDIVDEEAADGEVSDTAEGDIPE